MAGRGVTVTSDLRPVAGDIQPGADPVHTAGAPRGLTRHQSVRRRAGPFIPAAPSMGRANSRPGVVFVRAAPPAADRQVKRRRRRTAARVWTRDRAGQCTTAGRKAAAAAEGGAQTLPRASVVISPARNRSRDGCRSEKCCWEGSVPRTRTDETGRRRARHARKCSTGALL